jgi:hypothetical protein
MTEPLWFNAELVTNGQHFFTPLSLLLLSRTALIYFPRYHFRCVQLSEDDAGEISESLGMFQSP